MELSMVEKIVSTRRNFGRIPSFDYFELIENAPIGFYAYTPDGQILSVNSAFTKIIGYNLNDELKKSIVKLSDQYYVNTEDKNIIQSILEKNDSVSNYECSFRRKDETITWVSISARVVRDITENIVLILAFVTDITDRKTTELEIKRTSDQLRQVLVEKDKFFSIIAHDLRSPISGLLGLTKLLSENYVNFSVDELQKIYVSMNASVQRLFALLENLLEWASMQRGMAPFKPRELELDNLINRALILLRNLIDQKGISMQCMVPIGLKVFADEQMINSVLRNIFSNAFKFCNTGGLVTISAKQECGDVTISVEDDGVGMDQMTKSKIFSIDFKTSQSGTKGEKGSGLGLILCKEFMEKHGGRIWVESQLNSGCKISIFFPREGKVSSCAPFAQ
jgi:PAS domain S-box-containing protein